MRAIKNLFHTLRGVLQWFIRDQNSGVTISSDVLTPKVHHFLLTCRNLQVLSIIAYYTLCRGY